jgi:hypothetical protein
MKLLFENWRQFLSEGEEELEEGWKHNLALMAALAGAGPSAHAGALPTDSTPTTQQVEYSAQDDYSAMLGFIDLYIKDKPARERHSINFELMNLQKALDVAADNSDTTLLDALKGYEAKMYNHLTNEISNMKSTNVKLYNRYLSHGQEIDINLAITSSKN